MNAATPLGASGRSVMSRVVLGPRDSNIEFSGAATTPMAPPLGNASGASAPATLTAAFNISGWVAVKAHAGEAGAPGVWEATLPQGTEPFRQLWGADAKRRKRATIEGNVCGGEGAFVPYHTITMPL